LQEYLSDATQVDIVYLTVLNRASGEPLRSVALVVAMHNRHSLLACGMLRTCADTFFAAVWQWWTNA